MPAGIQSPACPQDYANFKTWAWELPEDSPCPSTGSGPNRTSTHSCLSASFYRTHEATHANCHASFYRSRQAERASTRASHASCRSSYRSPSTVRALSKASRAPGCTAEYRSYKAGCTPARAPSAPAFNASYLYSSSRNVPTQLGPLTAPGLCSTWPKVRSYFGGLLGSAPRETPHSSSHRRAEPHNLAAAYSTLDFSTQC